MNAYQKVISAEDDFNDQVARRTPSMNTSQPLSLDNFVIAQWAHEQNGHGGMDGSCFWARQHDFHLPRPTWLWPLLSAQFTIIRDQHRAPSRAPFPKGISQLLMAGWLHWITSITDGAAFCPYWNRHLFWI